MTLRTSTSFALIAVLIGCGAGTTSPLIAALESMSIAADVGAPVIASILPTTASWVALVPGVVTAAIDVAEGTSPLATAATVTTQIQQVWQQGMALLPNLSGTDKTVVTGILAAIQTGLTLFQKQFPPTATASCSPTPRDGDVAVALASAKDGYVWCAAPQAIDQMVAKGYSNGFFTTPSPATAKVKPMKLSKADKASISRTKAHIANVRNAVAARPAR